ncbi:serine hydrolase [Arthrobacter sp. NPDC093128]|uniref:serine hydrolase domain-containing protein n=1 Tax=Arthrobacter sp. NPDC093128 TaxID=3154979 RepID=UPI0034472DAD
MPTQISTKVSRYPLENFDQPVTLDNWQQTPYSRWGFSHVNELVTTAAILRSRHPRPWLHRDLALTSYQAWQEVEDFLEETHTDGFAVLHRGEIVYERYTAMGLHDRHVLMSVSKSICALVIGILVGKGLIDPEQPVREYVPALAGAGYGDATVRHVLDMTASVRYSENYADPDSEVRQQDRIAGWASPRHDDPADNYEFLASLDAAGQHGQAFLYCSAGTDVLAWVAENVTGLRYADIIATELWSRLGTEDDAFITTDRSGFAFANGGIGCTTRDLLRVGALLLDGGRAGGRQVVPQDWIEDILRGGDPILARGSAYQQAHPQGSYRSQFWVPGDDRGTVYAVGIHGQFVWVDPPSRTVIVKFSSCPDATSVAHNLRHAAGFRRVIELLDN